MALCTAAQVKTAAGITAATHDTLIGELIDAASLQMERFMGRTILSASYTEILDGDGRSDFLLLGQGPLITLTSVTLDGTTITSDVDEGTITTDPNGGRLLYYEPGGTRTAWPRGRANVVATYTAGWAAVPKDLEQACIEQVRWVFGKTNPGGGAEKLDAVSVGSDQRGTTQYQVHESGFLVSVRAAMLPYRERSWL